MADRLTFFTLETSGADGAFSALALREDAPACGSGPPTYFGKAMSFSDSLSTYANAFDVRNWLTRIAPVTV